MDESDFEIEMRIISENFGDYWWFAAIVFIVSLCLHASCITDEN